MEHSWNLGTETTVQPVGMGWGPHPPTPPGGWLSFPGLQTEVEKHRDPAGTHTFHGPGEAQDPHTAEARVVELIDSFNLVSTTQIL